MDEETKKIFTDKIDELNTRIQNAMDSKTAMQKQINHIDIEITQLIGAINEFQNMLPEKSK